MHDGIRANLGDQLEGSLAVPNVQFVMFESGERLLESSLIPSRVTLRPKERGTLVVVNSMDRPALPVKITTHLRAN